MYKKPYHIHFIGIGGIGMSGIARLLLHDGYTVSGCDTQVNQKSCLQLAALGAQIYGDNHAIAQSATADCIVYSTAIAHDHPELVRARAQHIPIMHRAAMLAELMRRKFGIAISGAHGKTTTTGMIAHMLLENDLDPSIIIGGFLNTINANAHAGTGQFFVAEADESDRSLLLLPTAIVIVTNIDKEHLETYRDLDDIKKTFTQFITQLPPYGCAIMCIDNEHIRALLSQLKQQILTYGFSDDAQIRGMNIITTATESSCVVTRDNIQELGRLTLKIPGKHMLQNALAAVAVGLEIGLTFSAIANALATFKGVERRFSYHGTFQGAAVYDDYGHHPNEIIPTIQMARQRTKGKLVLVFQPHRYSRTQGLWHEFITTLGTLPVDQLIVTDIYSAGEQPVANIESTRLVTEIKNEYPHAPITYVHYTPDHKKFVTALAPILTKDDLVLLMGAGNIYTLAKTLCKQK
jgi:UDP-N-acetylmuramate--alanine ligase